EQPLRAPLVSAHSDQDPSPLQSLPVQDELEIPSRISIAEGRLAATAFRLVGPTIPEHHRSTAVLTLRDRPLEGVVLDGMIFDLHREPFDARVVARTLGDRPALHDAVELEAKIEMEATRRVFLNDEPQSASRALCHRISFRLGRLREVALSLVLSKRRR